MTDKSREAFESYFKTLYIKTGFVSSKAEMEATWQACTQHCKGEAVRVCEGQECGDTDRESRARDAGIDACITAIKEAL